VQLIPKNPKNLQDSGNLHAYVILKKSPQEEKVEEVQLVGDKLS
jgi:hypothetical protein